MSLGSNCGIFIVLDIRDLWLKAKFRIIFYTCWIWNMKQKNWPNGKWLKRPTFKQVIELWLTEARPYCWKLARTSHTSDSLPQCGRFEGETPFWIPDGRCHTQDNRLKKQLFFTFLNHAFRDIQTRIANCGQCYKHFLKAIIE